MILMYDEIISNLFVKNRKCVINTDLDGLLSGMLLQKFLNWEIVGYSSCCGKKDDNLWLKNDCNDIDNYVFVDLPVATKGLATIDQHFVAFDEDSIIRYNNCGNKINPNIICSRFFTNNDYTKKYPFGTVHFVLATLERLGFIPKDYEIDFYKSLVNFDLSDLFLRADRVIGNTCLYTPNCLWWSDWMISYGGSLTKKLFNIVKNEYQKRRNFEPNVENFLLSLGCAGLDGECSNLFRKYENTKLQKYFEFLSTAFNMECLPIFDYYSFNKLYGERVKIENNLQEINDILKRKNLFSYAFVTMKTLSVTYRKGENNE